MATNLYFTQGAKGEQDLYEDIVIESLKMFGQDIYYLPRDIVNEDRILGEDVPSRFNSAYKVEMYIENIEGFDGEGDLFTKFGVEIRDQATFVISKRRWNHTVKRLDNEIQAVRPHEGDLLYVPFSKKIFEIMFVEHEQPFYQLKNLPTFKLRCELFDYNDEDFDTSVVDIDQVEKKGYTANLTLADSADTGFIVGNTLTQTLSTGVIISGEIVDYNDSSNVLSVANVGADDGNFHLFTAAGIVKSEDSAEQTLTRTISAINETIAQVNAQNDFFETLTDFLDFSESNPFGDPS
jgi:hypothetical protein